MSLPLDPTHQPSKRQLAELEKAFDGDLDLVLFFLKWIEVGQNATKAYQALHPDVDPASARVLGSRQFAKVNIQTVMEIYGIGLEKYVTQLKEGLEAVKSDATGAVYPDHKTRRLYHEAQGKLLGVEKGGLEGLTQNNTQNNFYLSDEQAQRLLEQ